MASLTQEHILISDVKDEIVLLKDGSACLILQTSAVNFGLLSEEEQLAIISSFAQMLNSLSFAIQIVIYSKRLDISSYIGLLEQAKVVQTNPLLSSMISHYKRFVESLIKEREVLDKKFYIAIAVSYLELGIGLKGTNRLTKIKAIMSPRKDQIVRQLSRVGLKATPLENKALIELFYQIYNQPPTQPYVVSLQAASQPSIPIPTTLPPAPPITHPPQALKLAPIQLPITTERSRTHPFVVEELRDNI